ncbi:MAG: hypothetical protein LBG70_04915 [Bifidobacteriaceae bacterium]|nr:hypothetical protein [Bifidobacteriaceae bacterium]
MNRLAADHAAGERIGCHGWRLTWLLSFALLAFLGGCSSGADQPPEGDDHTVAATTAWDAGLRWACYHQSGDGSDTALLRGRLSSRNGCLVVEDDELGRIVLPVLPDDKVSFNSRSLQLRIGDQARRVGSVVSFGGGYTDNLRGVEGTDLAGCVEQAESVFLVGMIK